MTSTPPNIQLSFHGGTVRVAGIDPGIDGGDATTVPPVCSWDTREKCFRLPASAYADAVLWFRARKIPVTDEARAYGVLDIIPTARHEPFPYQREALDAWAASRFRGVVVLPTGAGKTYVATMAIASRQRSTLVVVPTLDLLNQWYDILAAAFKRSIGIVGGGYYELQDITVTTYDSAHLHMERFGNKFGLIVFDECHHLPSPSYQLAAHMSIAPFRLGLTATPERNDGRGYDDLIGPIVYRKDITELSGEYLASYETERITVPLSPEEREAYDAARGEYINFIRSENIRMSAPDGWSRFLYLSSRSEEGRRAFLGYRKQRSLALAAPGKLDVLARLLHNHRHDRTIIFTEDNATVFTISRRFLVPSITHQTRIKERSAILASFNAGEFTAVVTSKVLNEGVNVPEANVAIVLSGNSSVREHVQRLGRILRKTEEKRARLYELVAENTSEQRVSDRRREHVAYK